jgi:hypothetical protein
MNDEVRTIRSYFIVHRSYFIVCIKSLRFTTRCDFELFERAAG